MLFLAILLALQSSPERDYTLRVAGATRSYIVHVPRVKPKGKYPLVVLLHGGGGNGRQAMRAYGMNEVADREGFLVAYPNGSGRGEVLLTWNAGNCCGYAMRQRVDDVAFIRAMVAKIDRDFGVDRSRVFVTGMSNGGMLTYRLGCEAADVFAAIAPVAGALNVDCRPKDAVAVAIFHGTADDHVPYDGGTGSKAFEPRVDRPVSHAVETWRKANGCTKKTGSGWTGCRDGTAVTLFTIEGGCHAWPASASEEIWKFFAAHPKR